MLLFKPGETAHIPIGTKHQFYNPLKDWDVMLIGKVVLPHEGFEESIYVL